MAIGSIVIAGMVRAGYSKEFAAGVICNAGTLGILIPPSIVMVVYGAATNTSVGRLFMAGVIPGIVAGLMLMVAIYVAARWLEPAAPAARAVRRDPAPRSREAIWGLLLIVIIMGGIYGGVFTPTEAAAVAAVYAFIVAVFVYRDMGPLKDAPGVAPGVRCGSSARPSRATSPLVAPVATFAGGLAQSIVYLPATLVRQGRRTSWSRPGAPRSCCMFIIANAMLFAHVLTTERIPHDDHRVDRRGRASSPGRS